MMRIARVAICCLLVVACGSQAPKTISCEDIKTDLNRFAWSDLASAKVEELTHRLTEAYGTKVEPWYDNSGFSWSSEQLHYGMSAPDGRPARLTVSAKEGFDLPKVRDLIVCFGEPEFYQSDLAFSPAGEQRFIYLWYTRIGVVFKILLDFDRRLRTGHRATTIYAVNPSSELSEMLYSVHWPNRKRLYALDTLRTWQGVDRAMWEE